ncbi:F0F1 ATP synthase subunit gamma [Calothrix sp. UHCC 0171]|uniref:F0F1 ATP synthase subunit gamma n=1 Tax=Calothrix sp. UHCC 0171 TaxID=3110245 RepID=UPI002B1F6EAA|nr:F0F1 ATP synthase subunit gamma [Calothrix sp. UHCC 0171]MEA5574357.1 F0F1 ATP synthase subunit gamma [Calothrix sp. UHCC 0171]
MLTLEALQSKIKSVEDLGAVVRTMKTLAMVNIRQYEKARITLTDYSKTIELGLQALLRERYFSETMTLLPNSQKQNHGLVGVILFGSDHGLCGQFNEQIVAYALEQLNQQQIPCDRRQIATVGTRLLPHLETAKQPIHNQFSLPSSIAGTTQLVQEILLTIEQWRFRQITEPGEEIYNLEQLLLFYNHSLSSTSYQPFTVQLLPLDINWLHQLEQRPWNSAALPTQTMSWERLFPVFIRQYLFVSLYQAIVESMASENGSRLTSMQAAEKNIEERLIDLNADYRSSRQNSITAELLDIIAGFEALKQPRT